MNSIEQEAAHEYALREEIGIRRKPVKLWWENPTDEFLDAVWNRMVDGAKKHGLTRPSKPKDYKAALLRHLEQYEAGDRSERHLVAIACNALLMGEYDNED